MIKKILLVVLISAHVSDLESSYFWNFMNSFFATNQQREQEERMQQRLVAQRVAADEAKRQRIMVVEQRNKFEHDLQVRRQRLEIETRERGLKLRELERNRQELLQAQQKNRQKQLSVAALLERQRVVEQQQLYQQNRFGNISDRLK